MTTRFPPAAAPAVAILAGALIAPRLAHPPATAQLALLAAAGAALLALAGGALGRHGGLAIVLLALGAWRAESAWVAPLRASPGWSLDRPLEASFEPGAEWEERHGDWSAPGRIVALAQDGRREPIGLPARAVVAGERAPPPAARYRLRGRLRAPLVFHNGDRPTRTGGWQLRVESDRFVHPERPPEPPGAAARARARLTASLAAGRGPGGGAALLEGLLLGRTSALPEDWQRALRRTGLSHLFAVSGLHTSLLAGAVWAAAATLRPSLRGAIALAAAGAYALVVGPAPTVLRSILMLAAMIGARLARRAPSSMNALALSAAGLVAAAPVLVYDLSFQLTVAATAGVIGLGPWLERRWGGGLLASPLAICAGAQLATLPLVVPAFSLLPLGGALLNLIAVPWTGACLVLGLLWGVVALARPSWGAALVATFDPLAAPFGWLAALPPHPAVAAPVALGTGGCCALAGVLVVLAARPRRLVAGALAGIAGCAIAAPRAGGELEIRMLDVGQGDALLVRDGGRSLLIDGGGWPAGDFGGRVLLPALARAGVRGLDAAVVSHPDADHCAGLADLAAYVPIREVWIAPGWGDQPCLRRLIGGVRRVRVLWSGDVFAWGRLRVAVLAPDAGVEGAGNDRSLVLEANGGGRSMLLTGDVSARVETTLVRRRALRGVDLLKVGHHGSASSTSLPLLGTVAPRWALISAGRANPYGHPAAAVVRKLERRRAVVLRTDRHGAIRLRWRDGGPLRVETALAPGLPTRAAPRTKPSPARRSFEALAGS